MVEISDGEEFPIESITQGVSVKTDVQKLTYFDFQVSSKAVMAPFDATVSTRFKGILPPGAILELVYPQNLPLLLDTSELAASVRIGQRKYSASTSLDKGKRMVEVRDFLSSVQDLTGSSGGEEIQITLNNLFQNPSSQVAIEAAFQI